MNMHTSIEPALVDPCELPFEAAITRERMHEVEAACQGFGVNRRVVLLLATQSRDEMANALRNLGTDGDHVMTTLELVGDFTQHCETLTELARSIQARLILACHDALGLSLEDTCPKAMLA